MTETYRERLGTTQDGSYVVVDVTIGAGNDSTEWQTVTHGTITGPIRLSITGEVYDKGARKGNFARAGQVSDALAEITTPAPGWSLEEISELRAIWDRWHLNDMRAGCAHMELPEDQSYDARKHITCPETGYKYGSVWLVEPLPDEVIDRVTELMRDRSEDLYRARGYDAFGKPVNPEAANQ